MNKREAERIARDVERHGLRVTGYRRRDYGKRGASWAVDVQDTATGYTFTVDEPGQWYERQSRYGNLAADTRTAGRPTVYGTAMVKGTAILTPEQWEWVTTQGSNRAEGLRNVVQQAMSEWHGRKEEL